MSYLDKNPRDNLDALLAAREERLTERKPLSPEELEKRAAKAGRAATEIALQQDKQARRDRGEVVERDVANEEAWAERERQAEEDKARQAYENDTWYAD